MCTILIILIVLLHFTNSSSSSITVKQEYTDTELKNLRVKAAILNTMKINKAYTITDLIMEIPECDNLTNQHVSALVRQLVNENLVKRIEQNRKAYFVKCL